MIIIKNDEKYPDNYNNYHIKKIKLIFPKIIEKEDVEIFIKKFHRSVQPFDIITDTLTYYNNIITIYCNPFADIIDCNKFDYVIYVYGATDIEILLEENITKYSISRWTIVEEKYNIFSNCFSSLCEFEKFIYYWVDENIDIYKWIVEKYGTSKILIRDVKNNNECELLQ
jgi:hypothetical protein